MADENKTPEAPAPAKAGTSKLLVLVGALNLGATGAVGWLHMRAPAAHAAAAEHAEAAKKPESGPIVGLDPFIVNLNEPSSNRYLKASFELQLANGKAAEEITNAK